MSRVRIIACIVVALALSRLSIAGEPEKTETNPSQKSEANAINETFKVCIEILATEESRILMATYLPQELQGRNNVQVVAEEEAEYKILVNCYPLEDGSGGQMRYFVITSVYNRPGIFEALCIDLHGKEGSEGLSNKAMQDALLRLPYKYGLWDLYGTMTTPLNNNLKEACKATIDLLESNVIKPDREQAKRIEKMVDDFKAQQKDPAAVPEAKK